MALTVGVRLGVSVGELVGDSVAVGDSDGVAVGDLLGVEVAATVGDKVIVSVFVLVNVLATVGGALGEGVGVRVSVAVDGGGGVSAMVGVLAGMGGTGSCGCAGETIQTIGIVGLGVVREAIVPGCERRVTAPMIASATVPAVPSATKGFCHGRARLFLPDKCRAPLDPKPSPGRRLGIFFVKNAVGVACVFPTDAWKASAKAVTDL